MAAKPASFVMGDGNLLPGFEKQLLGLQSGAEATFHLPADQAFGEHNPDNVQIFKHSDFSAEDKLEKGLVLAFADSKG